MITEGTHRGQLRALVDQLPDRLIDAAIAVLSVMVDTSTSDDCFKCDSNPADGEDGLCKWCRVMKEAEQSCPHCSRPTHGLPCECDHHSYVRPIGIYEEVDYENEWRAFRSVDDDPRPIDDYAEELECKWCGEEFIGNWDVCEQCEREGRE